MRCKLLPLPGPLCGGRGVQPAGSLPLRGVARRGAGRRALTAHWPDLNDYPRSCSLPVACLPGPGTPLPFSLLLLLLRFSRCCRVPYSTRNTAARFGALAAAMRRPQLGVPRAQIRGSAPQLRPFSSYYAAMNINSTGSPEAKTSSIPHHFLPRKSLFHSPPRNNGSVSAYLRHTLKKNTLTKTTQFN